MGDFTIEDLFNYRRKGAGNLADAYEQQQQQIADNETVIRSLCLERDALKAHVERLRSIAFPYVDLLPELVDWFDDTPHQSLAERDAEVAMAAIRTALRNLGEPTLTESSIQIFAYEYAQRIKEGDQDQCE